MLSSQSGFGTCDAAKPVWTECPRARKTHINARIANQGTFWRIVLERRVGGAYVGVSDSIGTAWSIGSLMDGELGAMVYDVSVCPQQAKTANWIRMVIRGISSRYFSREVA